MKTNIALLLAAALAASSAHAQLSQPQNGQLNSQINSQLSSQVNTGVNGTAATATSANGVGTLRAPARLGTTQSNTMGRTGAVIGTPGVTAPLGTIDNRLPATSTTTINNASGNSLPPAATGSSQPLNNGTWGGTGPNNTLTPSSSGVSLGTPGSTSQGTAAGAPTGR